MDDSNTNMASSTKPKRGFLPPQTSLTRTLFFIALFTIPALLLLHAPSTSISNTFSSHVSPWTGDLRGAEFAWNRLEMDGSRAPPVVLKIAVVSRKWPIGTTPGGMERHANRLHTALSCRGHRVHVFTSPPGDQRGPAALQAMNMQSNGSPTSSSPRIHFHEGEPGRWVYNKAWEQFLEENSLDPFDVVHSESVALPHSLAKTLPNLAVSWHGIALENLMSDIYQELALRRPGEPISPGFNGQRAVLKVLNEIRFFHDYAHHVATSDSSGEIIRDVYQIPTQRVHVILNGVDEEDYQQDWQLGHQFRSRIGIPQNASLVLGVAGRLVKDKGHPILHAAFSRFMKRHPDAYLIVAGSGPWENRYKDLGRQVLVLGSMNASQLRAFYNSIDIFANPTLRPQGVDQTQVEAMLSGKAILASRLPSIKRNVVVDDEYGFMFSPNAESLLEAMEQVAKEGRSRLAQRGKACRRYAVSMFSATKMALAYERLFLCIKNEIFCMYP